MLSKAGSFDQKYSKNCNIVKYVLYCEICKYMFTSKEKTFFDMLLQEFRHK